MNYYEARRLKDGSGWHFTCQNDGRVWPVGNCQEHGPHATAEEARECFTAFLFEEIEEESYGDWTGCEVCSEPTKRGLTARRPLGDGYPLCDEHRTPEELKRLHGPVGSIAGSH